jgi:hypothetical protein
MGNVAGAAVTSAGIVVAARRVDAVVGASAVARDGADEVAVGCVERLGRCSSVLSSPPEHPVTNTPSAHQATVRRQPLRRTIVPPDVSV